MLSIDLTTLTATQAVDGMRRSYLRTFGHSWVARRLARASWPAFRDALLKGEGIAVARSNATMAADARNRKTLLVARWTGARVERTVHLAVQNAANID